MGIYRANQARTEESLSILSEQIYDELQTSIGTDRLIRNASMKQYTSFKAGGNAELLVVPKSMYELRQTLLILGRQDISYLIMGNGTNMLVRDEGYKGVIVRIGSDIAEIKVNGEKIEAEAGALLSSIASAAFAHELTGFEFASGIPGSLGGAAFMNAGAYGGEMRQVLLEIRTLSGDGKTERTRSVAEMNYGYRKSVLMGSGELVLSAVIRLDKGDKRAIAARMKELSAKRNEKQPVTYPSAGSFFKRPEGYFAGKLIQDAGLMGTRIGGACVSTLHAGFIINDNGASATDIIALMKKVQDTVFERTGIRLEPEVQIIGEEK